MALQWRHPLFFFRRTVLRPDGAGRQMRSQTKVLLGPLLIAGICGQPACAVRVSVLPLSPQISTRRTGDSSEPTQAHAHQQKADEYLREKRPDLAIPEFAAVAAADPTNLDAQANL